MYLFCQTSFRREWVKSAFDVKSSGEDSSSQNLWLWPQIILIKGCSASWLHWSIRLRHTTRKIFSNENLLLLGWSTICILRSMVSSLFVHCTVSKNTIFRFFYSFFLGPFSVDLDQFTSKTAQFTTKMYQITSKMYQFTSKMYQLTSKNESLYI